MKIENIQNKLECCFATQIYNEYLKTRYGVNNCKSSDKSKELFILKKTFNYFYNSMLCEDIEINTANKITYGDCNISNLIERVSLL